ncbi:MAG: electron transfer flavoprotein subunit alpha/FixB family protein [Deferribacterota bacterium]|nr:electron transfer flavoprotein subunit alpha/FixB family protein [Deferribacterota bacterium]
MAILIIGEYRDGKFFEGCYDTIGYAKEYNKEYILFAVGNKEDLPKVDCKVYLADSSKYGEYNPEVHKKLIVNLAKKEGIDEIVFSHSSYGWDLAPRVANSLDASVITEVVEIKDEVFVKPILNGKLNAIIKPNKEKHVLTIQSGAFTYEPDEFKGEVIDITDGEASDGVKLVGYEEAETGGVDLTKAEVILSVGRGIGKKENIEMYKNLAKMIKAELGASRPIVDAEWLEPSRQVGLTGQTVSPKVYIACGISGSIQHVAGMKKSNFIIAINKDKEAPISEVADVLIVADVNQIAPALIEKLK